MSVHVWIVESGWSELDLSICGVFATEILAKEYATSIQHQRWNTFIHITMYPVYGTES